MNQENLLPVHGIQNRGRSDMGNWNLDLFAALTDAAVDIDGTGSVPLRKGNKYTGCAVPHVYWR